MIDLLLGWISLVWCYEWCLCLYSDSEIGVQAGGEGLRLVGLLRGWGYVWHLHCFDV